MSKRITWKEAGAVARHHGFTIRATGWGAERRINRKGAGEGAAFYTDCPEDAAGTIRQEAAREAARTQAAEGSRRAEMMLAGAGL